MPVRVVTLVNEDGTATIECSERVEAACPTTTAGEGGEGGAPAEGGGTGGETPPEGGTAKVEPTPGGEGAPSGEGGGDVSPPATPSETVATEGGEKTE